MSHSNINSSTISSSRDANYNYNSNKIHAIYVALDAHQYHRAIKLTLALPKSNTLAQALLAHALAKTTMDPHNTTKRDALFVLCDLMGEACHPELKLAKWRALQQQLYHEATTTGTDETMISSSLPTTTTTPTTAAASKKGKKKGTLAAAAGPSSRTSTLSSPKQDASKTTSSLSQSSSSLSTDLNGTDDYLLSWLDPPATSTTTTDQYEDWVDFVSPSSSSSSSSSSNVTSFPLDPYDETLLATLAVTLGNLQLHWTIYHMYCHASATLMMSTTNTNHHHNNDHDTNNANNMLVMWLNKAYLAGLAVLVRMVPTVSSSPSSSSSSSSLRIKLLNHCQVLALQLARYSGQGIHSSWAAQTAMWQYQEHERQRQYQQQEQELDAATEITTTVQQQQQRIQLLPRLAESIVSKRLGISSSSSSSSATAIMTTLFPPIHPDELGLYFETLAIQNKHAPLSAVVDELLELLLQQQQQQGSSISGAAESTPSNSSPWTTRQLLEQRAKTLQDGLQQYDKAKEVWETLLRDYPDQWSYWKHHFECVSKQLNEEDAQYTRTLQLALQFQEATRQSNDGGNNNDNNKSKYPIRALDLVPIEVAQRQCISTTATSTAVSPDPSHVQALFQAICHYGERYATQAAFPWSDLHSYLEYLLKQSDDYSMALQLMDWAKNKFPPPPWDDDDKLVLAEASRQLRAYMFGIQVQHQVVAAAAAAAKNKGDPKLSSPTLVLLPDWKELVQTWHVWNTKSEDSNAVQAQKESRLGDELILLAVQQLLWQDENRNSLFTAAVLLEWALSKSPYNANLKIQAMDVYAALQATTRCWELYRDLSIKHIQVDSCTYIILPYLLDGGLFDEVIDVCREIVRLHVSTVRDTAEYATRAMEHGTLSKAQEFATFQRERMASSLSALQAKGLIFDAAPLLAVHQSPSGGKGRAETESNNSSSSKEEKLYGSLGANHGIVGGESDLERAVQMIHELHNPFGAPSLVDLVTKSDSNRDPCKDFSDNRDQGIFSFQILHRRSDIPSKKDIVISTFRRGHIHGLLMRAVLVVDATKGPKKGKLVKLSVPLEKRCTSLLKAIGSASQFIERWKPDDITGKQVAAFTPLLQSLLLVGRLLVTTSSGMPDAPAQETMDQRETRVTEVLHELLSQVTEAKTCLEGMESVPFAACCRLLGEVVVSLFALFKMAATILNLFGWGKRKCKTKPSAAAMAQVAAVLVDIVKMLKHSLNESLPVTDQAQFDQTLLLELEQTGVVVAWDIPNETSHRIAQAHRTSRCRVEPILDSMLLELATFQPEE